MADCPASGEWDIGPGDLLDLPGDPRFDALAMGFPAAARRVGVLTNPAPSPRRKPTMAPRDLLAGAHLGFDPDQARILLRDHESLVFLGRLWDSARRGGAALGPVRVPPRIWELARSPGPRGRATAQLLAATGMALPEDWGQELEFHLALWAEDAGLPVRSSSRRPEPAVRCQRAVAVEARVRAGSGGVDVAFRPPYPGTFDIDLYWSDGSTASRTTPPLAAGEEYVFALLHDPPQAPSSLRIVRRRSTSPSAAPQSPSPSQSPSAQPVRSIA